MSQPAARRRAMMEARQRNAKQKSNNNILFEREKNRNRKYNVPYFGSMKKYVKEVEGIKMGIREARKYEVIVLENKMEVLCVQETDPQANRAAVSLTVNVGYFSDPEEMPGLAHLTEHMMFLGGNDTYQPGEFSKFNDSVGGTHNAYTVAEETNYHFDLPYVENYFEDNLDRFTSGFVNPTFTADGIKKEAEVVDNEHSKNIGNSMRSVVELLRAHSNSEHPFVKFSCGNFETLNKIPEEKGLDIPSYLTDFFQRHYSANRMKCVLIAPCSLDKLKSIAMKYFTRIENRDSVPIPFPAKPFTEKENFTRFDVIATNDDKEILLSFPLENFLTLNNDLIHIYLGTALGKNAPGSLVDYLEEKGWATSIQAFPMQCATDCTLYWVIFNCTEEGIWDHAEDIIHAFFIFMSLIYHSGLPDSFIHDVADSNAKNYARSLQTHAFSVAQRLASNMLVAKKEDYITHGHVPHEFAHETFLRFCESIVPEKMTMVVSHKGAEAVADQQEDRLKARFSKSKIDPELLERFNSRDKEVQLQIPKMEVEKEGNHGPMFPFQKPSCCSVEKVSNMPHRLKKNPVLKGETTVFVYVNEPKDETSTETVKDEPNATNTLQPPANMLSAGTRITKPKFQDINAIKKATNNDFMSRGVLKKGALGNQGGASLESKVKGIEDGKKKVNELKKDEFAFASEDVGRLQKMDSTAFMKELDHLRTPLLIKANNKSLLFFKQNVPTSMERMTTQMCVEVFLHPLFLQDYRCSLKEKALLNFYLQFLNNALLQYKKKMKFEHSVEISIGATKSAITISISGYNLKVLEICREIIDEMKRTNNFKWERFDRYKNALLASKKSVEETPLNICKSVVDFFLFEPAILYSDLHEEFKRVKVRDVRVFAEKMLQNCNLQVLVMGNVFPAAAIKMFDLLENSLKSSDGGKFQFTSYPVTRRIQMEPQEVFYVQQTVEGIFKDQKYEYQTYSEDLNSAYYCILQVPIPEGKDEFRARAIIALLGSLIDSPCREQIRTRERVGYLIHTSSNARGLVGSLEFIFQSNVFGPYTMDEKLDNFLLSYKQKLSEYSTSEIIKAKKGIASPALKPPVTVSTECDRWAGHIANGGYDFDFVHKFIDQLWRVEVKDLLEFYERFVIPGAMERRKLVIGVICQPHEESDKLSKSLKVKDKKVVIVEDPNEFKMGTKVLNSLHNL